MVASEANINHESSRKAFETIMDEKLEGIGRAPHINHESSRKAFETSGAEVMAPYNFALYQSRI